jgi:hypothetical protein
MRSDLSVALYGNDGPVVVFSKKSEARTPLLLVSSENITQVRAEARDIKSSSKQGFLISGPPGLVSASKRSEARTATGPATAQ